MGRMEVDKHEIILMIHEGLLSHEQAVAELGLDPGEIDKTPDPPTNPATAGF